MANPNGFRAVTQIGLGKAPSLRPYPLHVSRKLGDLWMMAEALQGSSVRLVLELSHCPAGVWLVADVVPGSYPRSGVLRISMDLRNEQDVINRFITCTADRMDELIAEYINKT